MHHTYLGALERGDANATLGSSEKVAKTLGATVTDLMRRAVVERLEP